MMARAGGRHYIKPGVFTGCFMTTRTNEPAGPVSRVDSLVTVVAPDYPQSGFALSGRYLFSISKRDIVIPFLAQWSMPRIVDQTSHVPAPTTFAAKTYVEPVRRVEVGKVAS